MKTVRILMLTTILVLLPVLLCSCVECLHTNTETVTVMEATCLTDGVSKTLCKDCGDIINIDKITAFGHQETILCAVAATCVQDGLTEGRRCTICDEVFVEQTTISAIGHIESSWIIDKTPTETENGKKHTECTVCGQILDWDILDYLSHTHNYVNGLCECGAFDANFDLDQPSQPEDNTVTYTITVVDQNGAPVAGTPVQLFVGDICFIPRVTDANGVVVFDIEPADYSVSLPTEDINQVYYFNGASTELTIVLTKN